MAEGWGRNVTNLDFVCRFRGVNPVRAFRLLGSTSCSTCWRTMVAARRRSAYHSLLANTGVGRSFYDVNPHSRESPQSANRGFQGNLGLLANHGSEHGFARARSQHRRSFRLYARAASHWQRGEIIVRSSGGRTAHRGHRALRGIEKGNGRRIHAHGNRRRRTLARTHAPAQCAGQ
jgi:hypothetical protein